MTPREILMELRNKLAEMDFDGSCPFNQMNENGCYHYEGRCDLCAVDKIIKGILEGVE